MSAAPLVTGGEAPLDVGGEEEMETEEALDLIAPTSESEAAMAVLSSPTL